MVWCCVGHGRLVMYVERDSRKQVLGKAENAGELDYLSRCLDLLLSTMVDAVPRLCSMYFLLLSGIVVKIKKKIICCRTVPTF